MSKQDLRQGKEDLALALRAAAAWGLHEGVCNHFSLMLDEDCTLINPQGLHWSEVTPEDIVVLDRDGKTISGRHKVEPTAFFIHRATHIANPGARCILHSHMPYATALACLQPGRLLWISQNALRFYGRVAYDDDYRGLALDDREAERIASRTSLAEVVFLANHGVVVCGATVARALDDLYYLERACQTQILALSSGQPLRTISDEIAAETVAQFERERQQSDFLLAAARRMF